jgi:hypothetical protein
MRLSHVSVIQMCVNAHLLSPCPGMHVSVCLRTHTQSCHDITQLGFQLLELGHSLYIFTPNLGTPREMRAKPEWGSAPPRRTKHFEI